MKRIEWLDFAKVFGIFLVVLAHIPFRFDDAICLFHMPLFFMLSGYLYKQRAFRDELIRSSKSLLVPYLIYNLLLLIVYSTVFKESSIKMLLKGIFLSEQEQLPYAFRALWFLISLFCMRILSSVLKRYAFKASIAIFIAIGLWKYFYGIQTVDPDPFQINSTLICYIFFVLGYEMRKSNIIDMTESYIQTKISKNTISVNALLICSFIAIGIVCFMFNDREVNVFRSDYGDNFMLFFSSATVLSVIYMLLFRINLNRRRIPIIEELSCGTIFILATHQLAFVVVSHFINLGMFGTLLSPFFALLYVFVCIFPIRLCMRFCPILLGNNKQIFHR